MILLLLACGAGPPPAPDASPGGGGGGGGDASVEDCACTLYDCEDPDVDEDAVTEDGCAGLADDYGCDDWEWGGCS